MSRRLPIFFLAALAALTAAPASADPECFGGSCLLLEVAEPPAEVATTNVADEVVPPEAAAQEASVAVEKPAAVKTLPQVVTVQEPKPLVAEPKIAEPKATESKVTEAKVIKPKLETAPVTRVALPPTPPVQGVTDGPAAPYEPVRLARREPVRLAPRYAKAAPEPAPVAVDPPADYARSVRVSSPDPSYVVGHNALPVGGIVVVAPGSLYGSGRAPVYMIAPSAKIISIDGDD